MVNKLILREKHPGNRISIKETALYWKKILTLYLKIYLPGKVGFSKDTLFSKSDK